MRRIFRRLLSLFTWRKRDRDMDREMAFHVESLAQELQRAGVSEADAVREARRRFGNQSRLKEEGHDIRSGLFLDGLRRDIRHGMRGLVRRPGFTLAVSLTLALGIGASVAIFSIVDQVLLRPLPYPKAQDLLVIHEQNLDGSQMSVSPANWLDWQKRSHDLQAIAVWQPVSGTLSGDGAPERLDGQLVSSEFFPLLGVAPETGRVFSPDDDKATAPRVVVLSHALWQRRFGGDRSVIGHIVQLNEAPAEIVGVMPAGFRVLTTDADFWFPMRLDRQRDWRNTAGRFLNAIARRVPGVPLAHAETEIATIAAALAEEHEFNRRTTARLVPLREEVTGHVERSLWMLAGAVGLLLAIACFNVASLLVARTSARTRELAIRIALGASRGALVRQLLVESVLLSLIGGLVGVVCARAILFALVADVPADLVRLSDIAIDLRVLAFAIAVSLACGVGVGFISAFEAARRSRQRPEIGSLGARVTQAGGLRRLLVIGQVAMTVVLLCGAGLLVRTVAAMNHTDLGFSSDGVLAMEVTLPARRYDAGRRTTFFTDAIARLQALPDIESAAAGNSLPLVGSPRGGTDFHRLGTPVVPDRDRPTTLVRVVTPGYFQTLGIRVLRGREFLPSDEVASAPAGFVVNESFARAFLADVDPLAAKLSVSMNDTNPYIPIVGVVHDTSEGTVKAAAQPTVFYDYRQLPDTSMTIVVRSRRPTAIIASSASAIHAIDPALAISRVRTIDDAIAEHTSRERLTAIISGAFAAGGLLLAALGLYGLLTYTVTERRKEFSIRLALGAQVRTIVSSIVGEGFMMIAVGAAIGVGGAYAIARSLDALLYRVSAYDPATYALVLGVLAIVTGAASYLAARQVTRVHAVGVLRGD